MKLTVDRTNFYIRKMTKADAETVCGWRYCGPQEIYNTENSPESVRSFLDGLHFAVSRTFGGKISAFIALGEKAALPLPELAHIYEDESYTDFALGLAPEECGKKQGEKYVKAAMELCKRCFPGDGFRVTVGRENTPAVKIYGKLGFKPVAEFTAEVIYPDNGGRTCVKKVKMEILIKENE